MKNLALLFIVALVLLNVGQCFAAFPLKKQSTILSSAVQGAEHSALPPTYHNNINDEGGTGLFAFGSGMGGLICYILAALMMNAVLLGVGFVLGILAIIFGAKGHNKRNQGFAIAGCILGIIEVSIPIIGGLIILLFAAIFSGA